MSCHDIGRGMNSVVRKIMTLLDSEQISKEAARTLILACIKGVHWCDGNEGEAIGYIHKYLCGNCLKKVPEGGKMYSIFECFPFPQNFEAAEDLGKELVSLVLCEECFDDFLEKHNMSQDVKNDPDVECLSRGRYNPANNGIPWPG